jgi:uncharacterized HAD superfamily protein
MLIAIDLDGVLADTLAAFISFHNEMYGTTFIKEHFHSDRYWEITGETKEVFTAKFDQFIETPYFQNIEPLQDAFDIVSSLARDHQLIVITARQTELAGKTNTWIKKHFSKKFQQVHVINHAAFAKKGKTMTKKEICQKLGVDILIEDSLENARECVSDKTKVLLLDTLWNQGKLPKGVVRVPSWKDIPKFL